MLILIGRYLVPICQLFCGIALYSFCVKKEFAKKGLAKLLAVIMILLPLIKLLNMHFIFPLSYDFFGNGLFTMAKLTEVSIVLEVMIFVLGRSILFANVDSLHVKSDTPE